MRGVMIVAGVMALSAVTAADANPMAAATAAAGAACAEEGGMMELAEGAAQWLDLTGDGVADDALVWEYGAFCAPDLGFRGGSGGAMLHLAVGDHVQSVPAAAWTVQDVTFTAEGEVLPPLRLLLLAQHGSACDGFGAANCVEALVWDGREGRFMSVAPAY